MVNEIYREKCIEDKYVYNIKVEDYHTYFVGNCGIWVHNKNCPPHMNEDGTLKSHDRGVLNENGEIEGIEKVNSKYVIVHMTAKN